MAALAFSFSFCEMTLNQAAGFLWVSTSIFIKGDNKITLGRNLKSYSGNQFILLKSIFNYLERKLLYLLDRMCPDNCLPLD